MLTVPKIENFSCSFDWTESAYGNQAQKISINSKFKFHNLKHVFNTSGTYIPNNDQLFLLSNIPTENQPNFLIVMCTGQLNITIPSTSPVGAIVSAMPVFRFWEMIFPAELLCGVNGLYIEGRAQYSAFPMPQGVPVDYFIIAGQAEIT